MVTNPLLEAKYKAQKQLSEQANYDMREYARISRQIVREVEERYGIKFKYIDMFDRVLEATEKPGKNA